MIQFANKPVTQWQLNHFDCNRMFNMYDLKRFWWGLKSPSWHHVFLFTDLANVSAYNTIWTLETALCWSVSREEPQSYQRDSPLGGKSGLKTLLLFPVCVSKRNLSISRRSTCRLTAATVCSLMKKSSLAMILSPAFCSSEISQFIVPRTLQRHECYSNSTCLYFQVGHKVSPLLRWRRSRDRPNVSGCRRP